jgi:hypothetical protein
VLRPAWVPFHGKYPGSSFDKVPGQRAMTSTDVEDQLSRAQVGVGDDAPGPLINKWMPAPCSS